MIRWHSIVGYSVVEYSVVGHSVVGHSGQTSTEYPLHIISYIIKWHSIVGYSVGGHSVVGHSVVGYSGQTWTEYPPHVISYMIRWHSIVGYSVVGYSRRWVFPTLGIPYSYRWHSTVGYSVVGHSIVGYSGHFARNIQRPKYPTFLLGILVVGYSGRWVFWSLGIPAVGYSRYWVFRAVTLYMYISLKIDKSQWCKKTYQVIAYSLIKKVSLQRNIDILHVKSTIFVYIQMHTKPHRGARTHACAYATRIHIIYTGWSGAFVALLLFEIKLIIWTMNLSDAHTYILCYAHTHKLTYMHTYRHKCIQIAFMYDHRFHFLCSKLQVQIHNSMMPKCFI